MAKKHGLRRLFLWIVADMLLLGAFLLAFAYFHHVRPQSYTPTLLASPSAAPTPEPTPAAVPEEPSGGEPGGAEPTAEPSPTPDLSGLLQGKYADKFTSGEVETTDMSYRSAKVSIEVEKVQTEDPCLTYYLADIYIQDISSFKTAVAREYEAQNPADIKSTMDAALLSELTGAILSLSGDNFAPQPSGRWIVRNGVEWVKKTPLAQDICVLYYDGTMETYRRNEADLDAILARGPYHIWSFGPELLDDGQAMETISGANGSAGKLNPRAAIGYYEPGHYCFLLADGRQKGYSLGMTCAEMSKLFYELGCAAAYNLDGGDTAIMCWGNAWMSQPENAAPRPCSDLLYIVEPDGTEAAE
ncbi:MAG: phosphodiester glycosidase family protein [Clostridia bacterium]|nr:phosphodiester glycosidase family protein [Clostridia bacterium]